MGLVSGPPGGLSLSTKNSAVVHLFRRLAAIIFMLSMLFSATAHAQVAGGTLSGTVSDPNGGGVPKASVVITNVATGVDREVSTNSDGFYTAVNLVPGTYQLKVTATGFNPEETTGIVMTVGAQQTLDVTLHVGTVSNRVEVTAETPAVQLTSSDISAVVNATTVRELPLNGRSWTDLAAPMEAYEAALLGAPTP